MEWVVADALSASVPPGVLRTVMQPPTERLPVDHVERCRAEGTDPSAPRRADIAVEFRDLHRLVIDVATTNLVCGSALSKSVQSHIEGIESAKDRRYKGYYGDFHPLVVSLGGGVSERGWRVIKRVCCLAARLSRPRLQWEPYAWAVRALRLITAGMARVMGWVATRAPALCSPPPNIGASGPAGPLATPPAEGAECGVVAAEAAPVCVASAPPV